MIAKHGKFYRLDIWVGKKRVRRSLRTDERAIALDRARELERELRAPKPPGVPFAEFAEKYKAWARTAKPAYSRTERYWIGVIRAWLDGEGLLTLEQISTHAVERLRAHLLTRPLGETGRTLSRTTANRYCALLRTMFNKARDWGDYHGDNPVSRVKFYREGSKVRPLTDAEIRAVLDATDALAARKYATPLQREAPALFRFILNTGLRRSEALNLKWADIGDDAITVRGKGGKTRTVPLNAEARAILERPRTGAHVFDIPGRSSDSILKRLHAIISEKTGVRFHVHLLRHAFASRLLAAGVDVVTIGQLLGHSASMVTLLYTHSNPRLMRAAVGILDGHRTVDAGGKNTASD